MECNFENCGYYTDGECNICGMGISGEDTFCRLCKDNPNCYYKQNAELKAENEKLKEVNKELAHYLACMTEQRNKANTCLQEIKEICKNSYTSASEDYYRTADKILQKINEVIGAEE